MCADLWSFALSMYARPGIEAACLRLQAQGADVCLMLCGAWLEQRGVIPTAERLQALRQIAGPWQTQVNAQQDKPLAALRERIKSMELEAERQLLMRLEELIETWSSGERADQQHWLERLAAEDAANLDHDALQQLRVAATGT